MFVWERYPRRCHLLEPSIIFKFNGGYHFREAVEISISVCHYCGKACQKSECQKFVRYFRSFWLSDMRIEIWNHFMHTSDRTTNAAEGWYSAIARSHILLPWPREKLPPERLQAEIVFLCNISFALIAVDTFEFWLLILDILYKTFVLFQSLFVVSLLSQFRFSLSPMTARIPRHSYESTDI